MSSYERYTVFLFILLELVILVSVLILVWRFKTSTLLKRGSTPESEIAALSSYMSIEPGKDSVWVYSIGRKEFQEYIVSSDSLQPELKSSRRTDDLTSYWDVSTQSWIESVKEQVPFVDNENELIKGGGNFSFVHLKHLEYNNQDRELVFPRAGKPVYGDVIPWTFSRYMAHLNLPFSGEDSRGHPKAYFYFDGEWRLRTCQGAETFDLRQGRCVYVKESSPEHTSHINPLQVQVLPPEEHRYLVVFGKKHYQFFVWLKQGQKTVEIDSFDLCGYDNVKKSFVLDIDEETKGARVRQDIRRESFSGTFLADIANPKRVFRIFPERIYEQQFEVPVIVVGDQIWALGDRVVRFLNNMKKVRRFKSDKKTAVPSSTDFLLVDMDLERHISFRKKKKEAHATLLNSVYLDLLCEETLDIPRARDDFDAHFSFTKASTIFPPTNKNYYETSRLYTKRIY